MSDYTPTTEEIREYVEVGGEPRPWEPERFDRRLAAHDAEVAAKALEDVRDARRDRSVFRDTIDEQRAYIRDLEATNRKISERSANHHDNAIKWRERAERAEVGYETMLESLNRVEAERGIRTSDSHADGRERARGEGNHGVYHPAPCRVAGRGVDLPIWTPEHMDACCADGSVPEGSMDGRGGLRLRRRSRVAPYPVRVDRGSLAPCRKGGC